MEEKKAKSSLLINGIEAEVCESGGKRFFSLLLEENQIPQYQRRVLEYRCCPELLAMYFVREQDKLQAYYDFGGFIQIKDMYREWHRSSSSLATESLAIIIAITGSIISAENYLFNYKDFSLHADTVFIRPNTGEVKLAYIPEIGSQASVSSGIVSLIMETIQLAGDEQWTAYGEEINSRILSGNESMSGIEKILHDMGRDICSNGWPEKSRMRREENRQIISRANARPDYDVV